MAAAKKPAAKKAPAKKPAAKKPAAKRRTRKAAVAEVAAAKPPADKFGDKEWLAGKRAKPATRAERAKPIDADVGKPGGVAPEPLVESYGARRREEMAAERRAHADVTAGKQPADHLVAHRFKPGQSGNPKGRPKGARSMLAEDFLRDMYELWQVHGRGAMEEMIAETPGEFVKAALRTIPKEVDLNVRNLDDMSDEDLDAAIQRGIAALGLEVGRPDDDRGAQTAH